MMPLAAMRMRKPAGPDIDPNFSSVSLLLHGNGANGSTSFPDSSPSPKLANVIGNTAVTTANPLFGKQSIAMDGSGDAILYAHTASMHLNGDFTIEMWLFPVTVSVPTYSFPYCKGGGAGIAWASWEIADDGQYLTFAGSSANSGYDIGGENAPAGRIGAPTRDAWNHVAVTRQGNVYRGFLNGVMGYNETKALSPYDSSPRGVCIGANYSGTWGTATPINSLNGQIKEARITKGVARYTADFTPPASEFPNS